MTIGHPSAPHVSRRNVIETRPTDTPEPPTTAHQRRFAALVSSSVFVLLLAGQFGLERVGLENPFPVPERVVAALLLVTVLGPAVLAEQRWLPPARRVPGKRALLAFLAVLLLSTLWSRPSPGLVDAAWDILIVLIALGLLAVALRVSPQSVVTSFAVAALAAGTLYALAGLAAPAARVAAFGGGPNVFARITGLGILAAIFLASREEGRRRGYLLALIPLLVVATVLSGSRGAMAGTLAGLIVLAMTLRRRAWRRILLWALPAAPVVVVVYARFGAAVTDSIQTRIIRLTIQERYTSGRTPLLSSAWEMFLDRPLAGWGLHGFEALHGWGAGVAYPHNLVIQLAAETGLIGLSAFAVVLITSALALRRGRWRNPPVAWALSAATLILVAAQFSGDYYDSRFGWAFLLIALTASQTPVTDNRDRRSHPPIVPRAASSAAAAARPGPAR